uniref:Uncharacterized protein n=1 Tax=Loa loa TaxID=7209 RepID=A0A1I7VLD2_LOALO
MAKVLRRTNTYPTMTPLKKGTLFYLDRDNSTKSKKNTSEIPDDESTKTKLQTLWINATYTALDIGLNITRMVECSVWNASMLINFTDALCVISHDQMNVTGDDASWTTSGVEILNTKEHLEELKLNTSLLNQYQV